MSDSYDWLYDRRVRYTPTSGDEPVEGTIVEIRDDSVTPDEQHVRLVIDTGEREVDVAKERVELL